MGKAALEGQPGVAKVTRGFRGLKEINTVTYDPAVITVDKMANLLQEARTLIDVAK